MADYDANTLIRCTGKLLVNGIEVIKIHSNMNAVVYVLESPVDLRPIEVDVALSPGRRT